LGGSDAVSLLVTTLNDEVAFVREWAASALSKPSDNTAIPALIKAMENDPDKSVRIKALWALGDIGDASAVPSLLRLLEQEDDRLDSIVSALGKLGDKRAVDPLIQLLSRQLEKRRVSPDSIVEALGNLRADRAAPYLTQILTRADCNRAWRISAPSALRKIGDPTAVGPLIQSLSDDNYLVRASAIAALVHFADVRAITPIVQRLQDSDPHVRREAAYALGVIGDSSVVRPLIAALNDNLDEDGRAPAGDALCVIEAPVTEELIRALQDRFVSPDEWCRSSFIDSAVDALGRLKAREAVPVLVQLLTRDDLRWAAASALAEIGDPAAVEPLIGCMSSMQTLVPVIKALAKLGDDRAARPIQTVLTSENVPGYLKIAAAGALTRLGIGSTRDVLIDGMKAEESIVPATAAEILGNIKEEKALPLLDEALADPDSEVRFAAAVALAHLRDRRALDILSYALAPPWENNLGKDYDVSGDKFRTAMMALSELGSEEAIKIIRRILTERRAYYSRFKCCAAVDALARIGTNACTELIIEAQSHQDFWVQAVAKRAKRHLRANSASAGAA
jgi:HEAT repeat protein